MPPDPVLTFYLAGPQHYVLLYATIILCVFDFHEIDLGQAYQ